MSLVIEQLDYVHKNKKILNAINLNFKRGKIYALLGPNGAGKSTLLKTIAGIWKPSQGRVLWQEKDLTQQSRLTLSQLITFIPQNPLLYFDFTVSQMVGMGCYSYNYSAQKEKAVIEDKLKQVNAWYLKDRLLSQLSGGEKQRVYIARALAAEAAILTLDEPTAWLDVRYQLEIWKLLRNLAQKGQLIIVAVHDLVAVKQFCDEVVLLKQGHCVGQGPYTEIITPHRLQEVFEVNTEDLLYFKT